jgi:hypothetical protein
MLTRIFAAVPSDPRPLMAGVVALALLGAPVTSAHAGGIEVTNCVRSLGSFSCVTRWGASGDPNVRSVPGPSDAQEEAEFGDRDRKWVARCRPIIRQDQYGVGRYYYAAPGCEFGRIQD